MPYLSPSPALPARSPAVPTSTLLVTMGFVVTLSLMGHDPHLAVMESLALITGTAALGR